MKPLDITYNLEDWFDVWLDQLKAEGYITNYYRADELSPIVLSTPVKQDWLVPMKTKVKTVTRSIMDGCVYTPDRIIMWSDKAMGVFITQSIELSEKTYFNSCRMTVHLKDGTPVRGLLSLCEVKAPPGYGGRNTSDAGFRVKQKWVFDQFGHIVDKVYLWPLSVKKNNDPYLFPATFTPDRYLLTDKTLEPRKISKWEARSLTDFVSLRRN